MKKFTALLLALCMVFTACGKEESWHPESTEVVFDTQQLTVEKEWEDTDLGSGEMDYYRVTTTAESDTAPFYSLTMTALVGVKYYQGQYPNVRDSRYSGYAIEEIRDIEFYGGGENMQFIPFGDEIFTEIGITAGADPKGLAVLWGNGSYQAEHDKKVKNITDWLPGMFFDRETTVKEYFRTEQVSVFLKLYVEEIVSCTPREYHLQIACTDGGVTFG